MKYLIPLLFLSCNKLIAQNWVPLANGTEYAIFSIFGDTIENRLYLGGNFKYAYNGQNEGDIILANGIVGWDGDHFFPLDTGQSDCFNVCVPPVRKITRFKNEIYVDVSHISVNENTINGIARWNGFEWDSLQNGFQSGTSLTGQLSSTLILQDTLIVGGKFSSAGDQITNSLAKWDENNWHAFNFPNASNGFLPLISSIVEFQGNIFVAGNFIATLPDGNDHDILMFDGNQWQSVYGGLKGGLANVNAMVVFQNELYITGFFTKSAGNKGNKIMKLGATGWSEVGGGVLGEISDIHAMAVHNGYLYIGGIFNYVGDNVPAQNLARWDGEKWCGFGNDFHDGRVLAIESFNDELYIAGGFRQIDDLTTNFIAKWIGGDYVDICGEVVSSSQPVIPAQNHLSISPNPSHQTLYLESTCLGKGNGFILNTQGQAVQTFQREAVHGSSMRVEIAHLPPGMYWIRWVTKDCDLVERFVKE